MTTAIDAAVTDLDGTLVDTESANMLAYADAFQDAGVAFDESAYRDAFGLRFREMFAILAPGADEETAAAVAKAKADRYPEHFDRLVVNEGLAVTLQALKAAGLPLGLATTAARRNVHAILGHVGLLDLFDRIVAGEDVVAGKPDPECYRTVCERLGVLPERAVVFEDSIVGVRAARAAGCAVVRVRIDDVAGWTRGS